MANKKITDLPTASIPLNDTDIVEIVQGGVNKKTPLLSISDASVTALIDEAINDTILPAIAVVQNDVNTHKALTNNPHAVTKTQVGLSNVDNTSDANKPVSSAQQSAIDGRVPKVLTANTDITGDFNLQLGTAANHLNSLSVYTETQLFFHAQDDLVINVHDGVTSDAVGIDISPNSMIIAAGAANSTTVTINDENSSTAFSVVANDGSIVITAAPGYNITLTADNIILTGNLSNFVYDEVPTGAINGVNTTYTIANTPVKGFQLFWNGMKLKEGIGFTRTGVNITMTIAPATNDTLECNYIK